MNDVVDALGAELEAAVVRALAKDWGRINYSNFREALRPPVFLLSDAETRLGRWCSSDRTIEIARRLVREQPWGVVVEVLKHEMAHQYAAEVLHAHDETAHGEAFRRTCERLGIDPAASGTPAPHGPLPDEETRILARIAKLLALAGSPNQHEAEVAMREAQRLMLKHNIDVARHAAGDGARSGYSFRHLGEPTGRLQGYQRVLGSILGGYFFVEPIWVTVHRPLTGTSGTVLEVCGSEANLEMAAYVHDFLLATAERLWRAHKREEGLRSDGDRRSYMLGVMRGFRDKLGESKEEQRQEGLVWVRDPGLSTYFDRRYPRRTSMRSSTQMRTDAFAAGREAGRGIVLHKPVGANGSGPASLTAGTRQLPPRRG